MVFDGHDESSCCLLDYGGSHLASGHPVIRGGRSDFLAVCVSILGIGLFHWFVETQDYFHTGVGGCLFCGLFVLSPCCGSGICFCVGSVLIFSFVGCWLSGVLQHI